MTFIVDKPRNILFMLFKDCYIKNVIQRLINRTSKIVLKYYLSKILHYCAVGQYSHRPCHGNFTSSLNSRRTTTCIDATSGITRIKVSSINLYIYMFSTLLSGKNFMKNYYRLRQYLRNS